MRHRLQWFIHLRAHGLSKGDEHSTPRGVLWHTLLFWGGEGGRGRCPERANVVDFIAARRVTSVGDRWFMRDRRDVISEPARSPHFLCSSLHTVLLTP